MNMARNRRMVAETKANARLIAAAPDLLEALKAVAACFDNEGKFVEMFQDQHSEMIEKMDAAIAKATGKNDH